MAHLLLVDDEPEVVNLLSLILTMYGYEVSGYTDARQALQEAPQLSPDLLLVDLIMPNLDGIGLVRAIDQIPTLAGMPVLMMTGLPTGELVMEHEVMHGTGTGILEKPCEPDRIVAEVARLLHEAATLPNFREVAMQTRSALERVRNGGDQPSGERAA